MIELKGNRTGAYVVEVGDRGNVALDHREGKVLAEILAFRTIARSKRTLSEKVDQYLATSKQKS
jgi:hypothetical protein